MLLSVALHYSLQQHTLVHCLRLSILSLPDNDLVSLAVLSFPHHIRLSAYGEKPVLSFLLSYYRARETCRVQLKCTIAEILRVETHVFMLVGVKRGCEIGPNTMCPWS